MKDMLQKLKGPIIIILVIVVLFVFYSKVIKKEDPEAIETKIANENIAADFLPLLLKIKDIRFDTAFFGDALYTSLKDFGQQIIPEDEGRNNPFSSISGVSASSTVEGLGFEDTDVSSSTTPAVRQTPSPARER